jgi:hypothetical protein
VHALTLNCFVVQRVFSILIFLVLFVLKQKEPRKSMKQLHSKTKATQPVMRTIIFIFISNSTEINPGHSENYQNRSTASNV